MQQEHIHLRMLITCSGPLHLGFFFFFLGSFYGDDIINEL